MAKQMERIQLNDKIIDQLVSSAREGTQKSFLTKPGAGTRYGAAVITNSGIIYNSGQYSSFNHITNIHAEMGSVLLATMSNDADIIGLALVSNKAIDTVAKMCGVCREFLNEHSQRIGHDINITFSSFDGSIRENYSINDLLPNKWVANKGAIENKDKIWGVLFPYKKDIVLEFGDMVELDNKHMAMMWDNLGDEILVKYKYESSTGVKIPHSFSEFDKYIDWLRERNLVKITNYLGDISVISSNKITGYKPKMSIQSLGLNNISPLLCLFIEAGIHISKVSVTGSRLVNLEKESSDYDLVVKVDYKAIKTLKKIILNKIETDDAFYFIEKKSNTLKIINELNETIKKRFFSTFSIKNGNKSIKISLIFIPEKTVPLKILDMDFSLKTIRAEVVESSRAKYKRSEFLIKELDTSKTYNCYSWHKFANLIEKGDIIDITGRTDGNNLYQIDPITHSINFIV